ncbi:MAG: hypothetical protein JXA74_13915, partial [Anaerolineae bacterium]|nr:hypothetical protein [Anaerolineae bacterium]
MTAGTAGARMEVTELPMRAGMGLDRRGARCSNGHAYLDMLTSDGDGQRESRVRDASAEMTSASRAQLH